jgi:hypothetical protein
MSDNLPILQNKTHPIWDALTEIQKPRSRFQLEKFVLGQHDTKEQQYKQCLLEIQNLVYTIQEVKLMVKKNQLEIDKLLATGDPIDAVDAEIKKLGMEQTKLAMLGAERELQDLVEMWDSFPIKYSHQDFEISQPEYWQARLTRQAQLEALGSGGKVGWSSLDSLRQIGELKLPDAIQIENETAKEIENGNS